MRPTANEVLELVTYLREQASRLPSVQPEDPRWQNSVSGALRGYYEGHTSEVNREFAALVPVSMRGAFATALGPLHGYLGRYTEANNSKILAALMQIIEVLEAVLPRLQAEEQRAAQAIASNVQGSIVAASAIGHDGQAHGTVNIHHYHHGLGYADVTQIVDEKLAAAVERLREGVGLARGRSMEDMLRVSFAVVQSLVAARLGAEPDAASVAEFLREAVGDPAFPARAARLFQEGAKTPSAERRELLARALFGIPAATPERDRIDAAIERLFPDDVTLLKELVLLSRRWEGRSIYLKALLCDDILYAYPRTNGAESVDRVLCTEWPLYALEAVGCVSFGMWSANRVLGKEKNYRSANLTIMPLGRSVIVALEQTGFALAGGEVHVK